MMGCSCDSVDERVVADWMKPGTLRVIPLPVTTMPDDATELFDNTLENMIDTQDGVELTTDHNILEILDDDDVVHRYQIQVAYLGSKKQD
jgi:hypothetical protein